MLTKKEIKKWLLENCISEDGDLDLSELDFSDFDGSVDISYLKVKKNLYQNCQEVQCNLFQTYQEVKGNLWQDSQKVGCELYQNFQKVAGDLYQDSQEVKRNLYQD